MATSQIQLEPKQRQGLVRRAKKTWKISVPGSKQRRRFWGLSGSRIEKDQEASVSWTRDALAAIKRIILIEERVAVFSKQATASMEVCVRTWSAGSSAAKPSWSYSERMAAPARRSLPEETER
jgi:hypothetical protein